MEFLKIFDAYSLRARLFPAVIATAPIFAALALLVSWKSFELSTAIVSVAVFVLFFAIADLARSRGRAIESKLFSKNGGIPSITMFRRNDRTLNEAAKERYRVFLARKLNIVSPSAESEDRDQAVADSFYEQCGIWLRASTRDTKRFSLLFGENVAYGFRRNLLGVKWIALSLNVAVVAACAAMLSRNNMDVGSEQRDRIVVVVVLAAIHAIYMLAVVRRTFVWDAAKAYGRELILSCEALIGEEGGRSFDPGAR